MPSGTVTGIDLTPEVIQQARELLSHQSPQPTNVTFSTGNVLAGLPFADASFDVVFCHQVLNHIHDPVAALREMKRVCKPGGVVAAREGDFPFRWVPYLPGIQLFQKYLYEMVMGPTDHAHPDSPPHPPGHRSGSLTHVWARQAGFDPLKIEKGASVQLYRTPEERKPYCELMTGRLVAGGHKDLYMKLGASEQDIEMMITDFKRWADDVDGWHAILQCETICRA